MFIRFPVDGPVCESLPYYCVVIHCFFSLLHSGINTLERVYPLPVDGPLGSFQFSAVANTQIHVLSSTQVCTALGYVPRDYWVLGQAGVQL